MLEGFEVSHEVTKTLFKFVTGQPVYVRIDGPIHLGKEVQTNSQMGVASLADVTNLETGETGEIIVSTVLQNILGDEYPEGEYIGKSFEMIKGVEKEGGAGQKYSPYIVRELVAKPSAPSNK